MADLASSTVGLLSVTILAFIFLVSLFIVYWHKRLPASPPPKSSSTDEDEAGINSLSSQIRQLRIQQDELAQRGGGTENEEERLNALATKLQIEKLMKQTKDFNIRFDELKMGKLIGKGSQGEVYKAEWRALTVAVKKIDCRSVAPEIIEEFCAEAAIMRRLRHPALTLFLGVSLQSQPNLCIVTEFAQRGSLFDIMHDEHSALTWPKCLSISLDIAQGMTYLHAHNPPILHRDLKSLNILVDENWRGKVADFGMTRFHEQDQIMTQCGSPLWMAPEMIKNDPYNEKSDVYSYGICLWEMYTRKIPYRDLGLTPSHLVVKVVKEGLRPVIPKTCPKPYRVLMERCWHPIAEKRPTFAQILEYVENMVNDPVILNHKPNTGREQNVLVREEKKKEKRRSDGKDREKERQQLIEQAKNEAGEHGWRIEKSEIELYQEPVLLDPEAIVGGSSQPLSATPNGTRETLKERTNKSIHNLNQLVGTNTSTPLLGVVPGSPIVQPSTLGSEAVDNSAARRTSLNTAVVSSPAISPLNSTTDGDLLSRNTSTSNTSLLCKFRNKVVALRVEYIDPTYINYTLKERVNLDLQGIKDDHKLIPILRKMSHIRHPNVVLFMGAYINNLSITGVSNKAPTPPPSVFPPSSSATVVPMPASAMNNNNASNGRGANGTSTSSTNQSLAEIGLLTEQLPRGSLNTFLSDPSLIIDWDTVMGFLLDIASALVYLHAFKPEPITHPDLSTDQCLIDANFRAKLNNCLSVDLQRTLQGIPSIATIFSAPEVIQSAISVNPKSNVYSFAMICWHALCRKLPFEGAPLTKELSQKITKGFRPHLPNSMSRELQGLISKCWSTDPNQRPTMQQVYETLEKVRKQGPPRISLVLGVNAHRYRKSKTIFAYRSKDAVKIYKDWGVSSGGKGTMIIFSGDDDVYLCDPDTFSTTYEPVRPTVLLSPRHGSGDRKEDDSKTGFSKTTPRTTTRPLHENKTLSHPASDAAEAEAVLQDANGGLNSVDESYHEWRKIGTIIAGMMEEAFTIRVNKKPRKAGEATSQPTLDKNGVVGGDDDDCSVEYGLANDYLVENEQGEQWVIDQKTFQELYERAD